MDQGVLQEPQRNDKRNKRATLSANTRALVWARAAGRCHFCNTLLIGDLMTGNAGLNKAYIAHIVSDSPTGPRGNEKDSPRLADDPENLMLLCDPHHREIDGLKTRDKYSIDFLQGIKQRHEKRIAVVTSIREDRSCHVVRFAAGIGKNESPVSFERVKEALLPERYPADGNSIDLDVPDLGVGDHDPRYWSLHQDLLRQKFAEKIRGRLERGEIHRLAVFALAPMPLLIELGRLLSDITDAEIRQLLREPKSWRWDDNPTQFKLNRSKPENPNKAAAVALKLEISAPIDDARVQSSLDQDASIWSLSAVGANNDILRSPEHLRIWRQEVRSILEAIKNDHPDADILHVFPAIPLSCAVELGRVWMPKAHLPMKIYDQNRAKGGFVPTISVIHEVGEMVR